MSYTGLSWEQMTPVQKKEAKVDLFFDMLVLPIVLGMGVWLLVRRRR